MASKNGKNGNGKKIVDLRVTELTCDPVQYKPYNPTFEPEGELVVRLEVPEELVLEVDDEVPDGPVGVMVVGAEGFQFIASQIANMIEDMHVDRQDERRRHTTRTRRTDD